MFRYYSKLLTLYKIGELHFRLLGTNGFHAKAENERFTAVGSRYSRTSNMEISRRHLADCVKNLQQKACRTCSTIIFPHSANQIIDLWCCRRRCRRHFLNSLLAEGDSANFVPSSGKELQANIRDDKTTMSNEHTFYVQCCLLPIVKSRFLWACQVSYNTYKRCK